MSTGLKKKTLKYKKLDDTEVKINLIGYPICPVPKLVNDVEGVTDFVKNLS
jgi:hypothetical protein